MLIYPCIHITSLRDVSCGWRKSIFIKKPHQITKLPMKITKYFDGGFQLKNSWFMHKYLLGSIAKLTHFIRIQEEPPIYRCFPVARPEQIWNYLARREWQQVIIYCTNMIIKWAHVLSPTNIREEECASDNACLFM